MASGAEISMFFFARCLPNLPFPYDITDETHDAKY